MTKSRTLKKHNKKMRGECESCGKLAMHGGCLCNRKRNFFGGKKSARRNLKGGECGCGSSMKLRSIGGSGFSINPTSRSFSQDLMIPLRNQAYDPSNPSYVHSERLLGGKKRKTKRSNKWRKQRGGDPFLGETASANMILNSGTTLGSNFLFNGLKASTNVNSAPYSQPNLQTRVV